MEENSCSSSYLNWSFRVNRNNNSIDCKTSLGKENSNYFPTMTTITTRTKFDETNKIPSFGNYVEKHGWIECVSKSIPGKIYYYNLRSGCSTWNRPISPYVRIERYPQRNRFYLPSDDSDECISFNGSSIKGKKHRREWILERLYYSPKKSKSKYAPRSWKNFPNNNKNKPECLPNSLTRDYLRHNEDNGSNNQNKNDWSDSVTDDNSSTNVEASILIDMTNFLECNLLEYRESYVDLGSRKAKLISNVHNSDEKDSGLSSTKFRDMLIEKVNKKAVRQKMLKKKSSVNLRNIEKEGTRKPKKIICNMYGVTTVNYDDYEEQFQPQAIAKGSNLSDSSTDVSTISNPNQSRSSILKHFGSDDLDKTIPPLLLSDSSSSSTSSSSSSFTCDTCSSTSNTITSDSETP